MNHPPYINNEFAAKSSRHSQILKTFVEAQAPDLIESLERMTRILKGWLADDEGIQAATSRPLTPLEIEQLTALMAVCKIRQAETGEIYNKLMALGLAVLDYASACNYYEAMGVHLLALQGVLASEAEARQGGADEAA